MGADNPISMVLLIFLCLFGIATTTKGTSFTIAANYLFNFLQFDSDNQLVVNINYNQFYYGISSQVIPSNIGPNLQDMELKLVGEIYVQCNSDIDCPIDLFCEKNACRKPGLVSNQIKGIQKQFPKNQSYIHLTLLILGRLG